MMLFSAIMPNVPTLTGWLMVGLITGWLTCQVVEEASYGVVGEIILAICGALVSGFFFGLLGYSNFWGGMLVSLIGACIFIGSARAILAVRRA